MAKLLDTFCGGGGCSVGYHRSGFDFVHGIDVNKSKDYAFEFTTRCALETLADKNFISQFDLIHASPPCQNYTTMLNRWRGISLKTDSFPDLIYEVFRLLDETGKPWVLENVCGAKQDIIYAVKDLEIKRAHMLHLSGGMFNLRVHRPRLFITNFPMIQPKRRRCIDPVAVYGDFNNNRVAIRKDGSTLKTPNNLKEGQDAMGINWMNSWKELKGAIPPNYTEYVGREFFKFSEGTLSALTCQSGSD